MQALEIFEAVDVNHDGVINKTEVKKYCATAEGAEIVQLFDVEHTGWAKMWATIDSNYDGEVTKDEWVAAYTTALRPTTEDELLPHQTFIPSYQLKVFVSTAVEGGVSLLVRVR